ncbi:MAG: UDP-N-acetylglucosamine--N-acetylmuramyl-(pentapeptide) pyrophosphoryl-undecaprenol N-acetylglucosamine transferase [Synergistaceae bacterium]|nr:UDP-N-acetylglucosamine--N-acetylmuramyl-(pentapeptide) pyrophosphoryl-undecaprenol N-acetylglucosamine transferase [Synergistaceae bacterium]
MNSNKILIAAGGTGGHIFPAIVFGKNLESQGSCVSWICGSRKLESEIYESENIKPIILPLEGSPLGTRSITKIFSRIINIFKSLGQISEYIKTFKPDHIYLFGGYISFAPLIIARAKRIPVTLHEQNAAAGKVTRFAERIGAKIITGWPECQGIKNFTYTGIPVREPERLSREQALKTLGLEIDSHAKIIGIAGGSLGSGPLSEILTHTADSCKDYQFIFLSSRESHNDNNKHYILPQWDMNPFYSACDLIVCRAGGSTLAELLKWEIPSVIIPWPGAADNHQVKNAQEFIKLAKNSCIFYESENPEKLVKILYNYLK